MALLQLDALSPTTCAVVALASLPLILFLLERLLFPQHDPRGPPLLRPKIPLIGHVISILWEGTDYYARLFEKYNLPITALPLPTSTLYVVNSPALMTAVLKHKHMSLDEFIEVFSVNALGLSREERERFKQPGYMSFLLKPVYPAFSGEALRQTAGRAGRAVAGVLNRIGGDGDGVEVEDVTEWLREVVCQAVMVGLYGERNPVTVELQRGIWDFEKQAALLVLGIAPWLLGRKAVTARKRIQAALKEYYAAGLDQGDDVSTHIKNRAAAKRKMGIKVEDIATADFDITWLSVTNTIPTMVWFFLNLFSRPTDLERFRGEVLEVVSIEGNKAIIDTKKFEKQPFINAYFHEVLRFYAIFRFNRHVAEDTLLRDADGREYLLKKGADVEWFAGNMHWNQDVWGDSAHQFNPERFMSGSTEDEKKKRTSMTPFSAGKYMCPGRLFATVEILSVMAALVLAFDFDGLSLPEKSVSQGAAAMGWPRWGKSSPRVKIKRRKSWGDVELDFAV